MFIKLYVIEIACRFENESERWGCVRRWNYWIGWLCAMKSEGEWDCELEDSELGNPECKERSTIANLMDEQNS